MQVLIKADLVAIGLIIALILIYCSDKKEACKICTTTEYRFGEPVDSVKGVYCGSDVEKLDGRIIEIHKSWYFVVRCE